MLHETGDENGKWFFHLSHPLYVTQHRLVTIICMDIALSKYCNRSFMACDCYCIFYTYNIPSSEKL